MSQGKMLTLRMQYLIFRAR